MNHVSVEEVEAHPDAVIGKFLVKSFTALVLFDTGASHSFMLEDFACLHDIKCEYMNTSVTPLMRLYLPRVEARLRGITALKAMSQVR